MGIHLSTWTFSRIKVLFTNLDIAIVLLSLYLCSCWAFLLSFHSVSHKFLSVAWIFCPGSISFSVCEEPNDTWVLHFCYFWVELSCHEGTLDMQKYIIKKCWCVQTSGVVVALVYFGVIQKCTLLTPLSNTDRYLRYTHKYF